MDTTAEIRPADSLADLATTANAEAARGAESLCIAGDALLKAKKMVPHGEWKNWLLKNWRYSYRHAVRLMRAAEVVGRSNPDNVLTAIALPDTSEPETQPKVTSMSPLMTPESSHNGHQNDQTPNKPIIYVYEEIEIPEDRTSVPPPPAPSARQPRPEPASRWSHFTPKTLEAKSDRTSIDEVKSALSRLSRRLTIWINETEEGERFAKYVIERDLCWVVGRDCIIKGRRYGRRFVGLREIRRMVNIAQIPKQLSAHRLGELWGELDPEGDE